jgi:putative ABC transport system substrate-binding protein
MNQIQRRKFLLAASALLAAPLARAQLPAKVPRIGVLLPGSAPSAGEPSPNLESFRHGLRELGYVEGRSIAIEYRWAEGKSERFPALAAELVRLEVAVIVASSAPGVLAAKAATSSIPIVMTAVGDPVGIGAVASLARPGGNVTGLSSFDADLDAKRLELLKETVPGLTRVGILWSANDPGMTLAFNRVQGAAQPLRLSLQSLGVRDPAEFDSAFQAARAGQVEALIVTAQPFLVRHRAQILDLVARSRLPAMYTFRSFVDAGGLMSYAPSLADIFRRAAGYVDKIVKGANPATLPVEQPTRFELVVNMKTAKALGLTIPPLLLLRADEVIE